MPCVDNGREEVLPEMNQSNSATTARRKTRFVVKRGSISVGESLGFAEGHEREKRKGCGANIE
jgi:predicted ribonuclease YlaK